MSKIHHHGYESNCIGDCVNNAHWPEAIKRRDAELADKDARIRVYREALEEIEEMTSNGEPYHGDMAWEIAKAALNAKENR